MQCPSPSLTIASPATFSQYLVVAGSGFGECLLFVALDCFSLNLVYSTSAIPREAERWG